MRSASEVDMIEGLPETDGSDAIADLEATAALMGDVRAEISKVIFGQKTVIDLSLTTLLAGGHALLVGVPGLAKTRLAETLGAVLGLDEKRVQFTPDLMPSDILGSEVLEQSDTGERAFRFIKGPVFSRLLMADEINRASPRTQSALLQSMQEKQVSIAGTRHDLPKPFHVLATQNPLEQEGTYPLPEAQLDRFLMQIDVEYPDEQAERDMLISTTGPVQEQARAVLSATQLMRAQALVRQIPTGEQVVDTILEIVRSARPTDDADDYVRRHVAWGPGPRASQALLLGVRARALLEGRLAPSVDDVIALAPPILRHRMALTFTARADGLTIDGVVGDLLRKL